MDQADKAYDLDTETLSGDVRVALLSSMEIDTDEIARYTGIPESTVVRVLDAWRKEIGLPARARA